MIKNLFKNKYFLTLFVKVTSLTMSIVSSALLARYMGASIKGQYATVESVAQIVSVFLNLGIYHIYPQMIKDNLKEARQKFIDIFFFLFVIYSTVGLAWCLAARDIMLVYYCSISIVSCLVAQLTMVCMVEYPIYRSLSTLVLAVVNFVLSIIIFLSGIERFLFVPMSLLLFKDVLFILIVMAKLKTMPRINKVDYGLLKIFVAKGIVPMLTALLLKLNYKVDIIMLNFFKAANSSIGSYSVGVSIADQLWIVPEAFKEVLYSSAKEKKSERSFVLSLKISSCMLLFMILGMFLVGNYVVYFLYGVEFKCAFPCMCILLIGVPFMGIFNIMNPYYLSQGKYSIHMLNLALGVISNIIVNSILIRSYTIYGAAVATSVSQIVCGIFASYQFSRGTNISIKEMFIPGKKDVKEVFNNIHRKNRGKSI